MQLPSSLHRSSGVISALDNGTRNMADLIHIVKNVAVLRKPTSMDEIMARDREREREREREKISPSGYYIHVQALSQVCNTEKTGNGPGDKAKDTIHRYNTTFKTRSFPQWLPW